MATIGGLFFKEVLYIGADFSIPFAGFSFCGLVKGGVYEVE